MSRIRANKITNKGGTGAVQLEKGAEIPVGMGITGAGGLNITGVVTATSFSGNGAALTGIDATSLKDPAGNIKIQAQASGAVYTGIHTFTTIAPTIVNATQINATAGAFTGNVSIGGTLTYEDVTNIDSVGIVTAREGIFIPDNKEIKLGNTAGSPDMKIHHDGNHSIIEETGTGNLFLKTTGSEIAFLGDGGSDYMVRGIQNGATEIYHNAVKKLETTSSGVTVTGTVAATAYTGDGSGLSGITVGVQTEALTTAGATVTIDLSKDDHKITKSGTYTITCTGGTEASSHTLRIVNSGISTVGFSTYFLFPSGGTPALPTANGAISVISFTVHRAGSVGVSTQLLSGASVNFS